MVFSWFVSLSHQRERVTLLSLISKVLLNKSIYFPFCVGKHLFPNRLNSSHASAQGAAWWRRKTQASLPSGWVTWGSETL